MADNTEAPSPMGQSQQISSYQGIVSPNTGVLQQIPLKGRMDEQLDSAESACARLEQILSRAREALAPYTRIQEPGDKAAYPDVPALGLHAGRIAEVARRVNGTCDNLIDLLDSLDV